MSALEAIYKDYTVCCDEFSLGIDCLKQRAINQAVTFFYRARQSVADDHPHVPVYQCYYGYARVLGGDEDAIDLCRQAVEHGARDADTFYILARAEMFCGNRRQMVRAMGLGLQLNPQHPGLLLMRKMVGYRQSTPIPFLPRGSLLNRSLGRLMRKK